MAAMVALMVITGTGVYMFSERAKRGRRLTNAQADSNGNVPVPPIDLAVAAGRVIGEYVNPEDYALARMLHREGGSDNSETRRFRAWIAYNDAKQLSWSFVKLFSYSNDPAKNGRFGTQAGRRYATTTDPYEGDLADARALRNDFASGAKDPTNGATKFTDDIAPPVKWLAEGYIPEYRNDLRPGFIIYRKPKKVYS